jgi:hypothetical protein
LIATADDAFYIELYVFHRTTCTFLIENQLEDSPLGIRMRVTSKRKPRAHAKP